MSTIQEKSEILFLYESKYSTPNGDPFTGEQRYDETTKKVLVSDVRIKRFIRDYLNDVDPENNIVYVMNDRSVTTGKESGSSARVSALEKKFKAEIDEAKKDNKNFVLGEFLLKKCIDVRLFGGISTVKKQNVNLTGPVQFALLNPSLNSVDLRIHQNTSVFASSTDKKQGAIGTTSVVPYCVNQIHGWINPFSAKHTGLMDSDVQTMFKALWDSINNANTRSKSNQGSLLLIQIVYAKPTDKVYGVDTLIKQESELRDEELRSVVDYSFNLEKLKEEAKSDKIKSIQYYTELAAIEKELSGAAKFTKMNLS